MRTRTLLLTTFAALLGGALLASDVRAKDTKITRGQVKVTCGQQLHSGGGAFGCTKDTGSGYTDYSCNYSGKGRQGCWKMTFPHKMVPAGGGKGTKGLRDPVTGVKGVGAGGDKGKGVGSTSGFKPAGPGGFVRRR